MEQNAKRRRRTRRTVIVGVVAGTALVIGCGAAMGVYSIEAHDDVAASSDPMKPPEVTARGKLTGFYPGKERSVRVTVRNPNPYPIKVNKIDAYSLKTPSGCTEFALESRPFHPDGAEIGAGAERTYPLTVFLNDWAGNECGGQRFTLRVRVYSDSVA